ncbi:hypothetical protein AgCh_034653 [Apium graveolens]
MEEKINYEHGSSTESVFSGFGSSSGLNTPARSDLDSIESEEDDFMMELTRKMAENMLLEDDNKTSPVSDNTTNESLEDGGWHDLVANGFIEYIDTEEEETTMISMTINYLRSARENPEEAYSYTYTPCEIHPSFWVFVLLLYASLTTIREQKRRGHRQIRESLDVEFDEKRSKSKHKLMSSSL